MDYNVNKDRYLNGAFLYDNRFRQTFTNDKSKFVNGKLQLKENAIHRQWREIRGMPPCAAVYQNGGRSLYSIGGYQNRFPDDTIVGQLTFNAQQDAVLRFNRNASNQALKLAEYVLERAAVKQSFIDLFKSIVRIRKDLAAKRLFKTLIRKNGSRQRVELSLSEKWLSYSFMWAPLINDAFTLAKGFTPVKSDPIRVRGYASLTKQLPTIKNAYGVSMCTERYDVRVAITGSVVIEDPLLAILDEIGLADPGQIIWDKLPFSFVVDWFINLGSLIDQACMPGKSISNSSVTTLTKFSANSHGFATMKAPPNGSVSTLGSGVRSDHVTYQRVVGPVPPLHLSLSGGINSLWRLITSAAILRALKG